MEQFSIIADVGGTNARFALVDWSANAIIKHKVFPCNEFDTIEAVFAAYFDFIALAQRPKRAAIAIANPVTGDQIKMTNHHWSFSIQAVKKQLGLSEFIVLNDFTALAMSLPHLGENDIRQCGGVEPVQFETIGLIGPGTGLGVSGLVYGAERWHPLSSEGGHNTYVAVTEREQAMVDVLQQRFGHVSFERVVSGFGLLNVYQALTTLDGINAEMNSPSEISDAALSGSCPLCKETVDIFCAGLGTAAGNLALTLGARGGVYIGGGIVPRLGSLFEQSEFRARFESKGRFKNYLSTIPTYLILADFPALIGTKAALMAAG